MPVVIKSLIFPGKQRARDGMAAAREQYRGTLSAAIAFGTASPLAFEHPSG